MNTYDERINKLRELMSQNGISFYIIPTSDPHGSEYIDDYYKDREYMTGFTGSAGTLVVSKDEAALFVDGRYHIQADEETKESEIAVYKLGLNGVPTVSDYIKKGVSNDSVVAFDGRVYMQKDYTSLKEKLGCSVDCEMPLLDEVIKKPNSVRKNVFFLDDSISGKSVADKLSEVRNYIKEKEADALFLSALDDICYLFNFRGSDIAYNTVAYSYAYITEESATLYLCDGVYDTEFKNILESQGVYIDSYDNINMELAKVKSKRVLLDPEYTSSYLYKVISLGNEIISINNYEAVKKHIKNEIEQNLARKYAVSDAVALVEYIVKLKEAILEGFDIDEAFASNFLTSFRSNMKGFYCLSFENICAYAENAAIVHYAVKESTAKKIKNKGLLLVDSGSHYMGATTDVTRTIVCGELTEEEKIAYTLVLKGNLRLMDAIFLKGTRCENLDILAREPLWQVGLDYRHGTGHGIGSFLSVHEGPFRIAYKIREDMPQPEIEPGMIISDEPGYYEEGKFGIRHETQLLCVKKFETDYGQYYGFEPLTLVPFERDAIIFEMLNNEEFEALKRYSKMIRERILPNLSDNAREWLIYNTNYVD